MAQEAGVERHHQVLSLLKSIRDELLALKEYQAIDMMNAMLLVHELRHAAQDAHFDLAALLASTGGLLRALSAAGLVAEPAPRFGLRMISLGMALPIVLGFGALLVPTFTMMKRPLAVS